MGIRKIRTLTTNTQGPTVAEINELVDGISAGRKISIHVEKGDIHDPGYITFTVEEG